MVAPTRRTVTRIALDRASDGEVAALVADLGGVDLVVMVAAAGTDASAAAVIGDACSRARVTTLAIVVSDDAGGHAALSRTLAHVRPWAVNVVVASDAGAVDDILGCFR